jgi:hypothetical protein
LVGAGTSSAPSTAGAGEVPVIVSAPAEDASQADLEARLEAALTDARHWKAEAQRLSAAGTTAAAEEQLAAERAKAKVAAAIATAECALAHCSLSSVDHAVLIETGRNI